jgi:hypothetical protein
MTGFRSYEDRLYDRLSVVRRPALRSLPKKKKTGYVVIVHFRTFRRKNFIQVIDFGWSRYIPAAAVRGQSHVQQPIRYPPRPPKSSPRQKQRGLCLADSAPLLRAGGFVGFGNNIYSTPRITGGVLIVLVHIMQHSGTGIVAVQCLY